MFSKTIRRCALATAVALWAMAAVSCEVEFSPNAEWKDVPVIYCVLDQDDDTTWARVERCYLGDKSIYSYSGISDSINYAPGTIDVALLALSYGEVVDSMAMQRQIVDRAAGNFASEGQPVYCCRTRGRLRDDCHYVLRVRSRADGHVMAESKPTPLVVQNKDNNGDPVPVVSKPANTGAFGFYESRGPATAFCRIEWPAMQHARLYEPIVRFYYAIDGDTSYTDFKCGRVKGNSSSSNYYILYSRSVFLDELKQRLKDDPRQKKYVRRVDIFLNACSEELNAYSATAGLTDNVEQGREVYSNIEGGKGIVASRRTHLYKRVPSDSSMRSEMGLYYFILNLGINMI